MRVEDDWYLDLCKYGGVKHRHGLGFERMVMYVTGMANIRDVLPFHHWKPRNVRSCRRDNIRLKTAYTDRNQS